MPHALNLLILLHLEQVILAIAASGLGELMAIIVMLWACCVTLPF